MIRLLRNSSDSDSEEETPQRRHRVFRPRINLEFEIPFQYNERFRMNSTQMENILQEIGSSMESSTNRNHPLSSKLQLCVAMHWLGTGCQYHAIGDMHGVSKSSVCKAVHGVVRAVNEKLFNKVVAWPEDLNEVISQYHAIAGMPLVIGSVDGTLIEIDAPTYREDQYVDRHGKHSINCMAVCGPSGKFYYVSARWPGSVHDSRVLKNSSLYRKMECGWRPVPNCIILGDSGYPLLHWLLTPTGVDINQIEVRRYNKAHKSTRRIIENAFGILKEKFPCLNYLRVNPTFACEIFKCCTALCNISRTREDDEAILREFDADEMEVDNVQERTVQGQSRLREMIQYFRN